VTFNPFFNLERPAVVEAIAEIQGRLIAGAAKVAHAGSGGIDNYTPEADERNLTFLARRLAEIDGIPTPTRAQIRGYVIDPKGYGHARRAY